MTSLISFTIFICFSSILSSIPFRASWSSSGVAMSSARSRMIARSALTIEPGFSNISKVKSGLPFSLRILSSRSWTIGSSPDTSSKNATASSSTTFVSSAFVAVPTPPLGSALCARILLDPLKPCLRLAAKRPANRAATAAATPKDAPTLVPSTGAATRGCTAMALKSLGLTALAALHGSCATEVWAATTKASRDEPPLRQQAAPAVAARVSAATADRAAGLCPCSP
mmetsp:Transcript_3465/g.10539  ORF Transcript_3465/g.10539 Transcript_3465/m.10539 type:complete len:227 (-) Transcript_3465:91-771(-)